MTATIPPMANLVGSFSFIVIISVVRWAVVRHESFATAEQVKIGSVEADAAHQRLALTKRNFTMIQAAVLAGGVAAFVTYNSPLWVGLASVLGAVAAKWYLK